MFTMKRLLYTLILVFIMLAILQSHTIDPVSEYIQKYSNVAQTEMKRAGIPASIKLAQALLESDWGRSELAQQANNHFGIKCGSGWVGNSFYREDDDYNSDGKIEKSCFRTFDNPIQSYISHTDFLVDPKKKSRYGFLFEYKTNDYVSWAYGLKTSGYASDPKYPEKLISIIEKYNLQQFDNDISLSVSRETYANQDSKVFNSVIKPKGMINGTQYVISNAGETAYDISKRLGLEIRKLLSYNDIIELPQEVVPTGSIIFTSQKKRDYEGDQTTWKVMKGQNLAYISQQIGVRSRTLRSLNKMKAGQDVVEGDVIILKKMKSKGSGYLFDFQ